MFSRIGLALGYLKYALTLSSSHYTRAALDHSFSLAQAGHPCWVNDLKIILSRLQFPVHCTYQDLSDPSRILKLSQLVTASYEAELSQALQMATRLHLLNHRLEYNESDCRVLRTKAATMRAYLVLIKIPKHRQAFTRLLTSSHSLSVERLRYQERYRNPIPREWRRCRFCHLEPEDECHALLICNGNEALLSLRSRFIQQVYQALPVCQTPRAITI
ncbi:hypothetical protein F5877DRAFT_54643 [Lentinula edodes]|nr:hypothetical protein F5877DRAFT_54643 [Lentinula edodes]